MTRLLGAVVVVCCALGCSSDDDTVQAASVSEVCEGLGAAVCGYLVTCAPELETYGECRTRWVGECCAANADCAGESRYSEAQLDACVDDLADMSCAAEGFTSACRVFFPE